MKFLAGLAALASVAAAAPSAPTPLDVKLEMTGNSQVKATITNTGKNNLRVFKTGTILDKSAIQKVQITGQGQDVTFHGIRQRISTRNIKDEAFQSIPAGKSVSVTFDVGHVHDLSAGGKFNLLANGALQFANEGDNKLIGSVPFHSNKLEATVDGAQAASILGAFGQNLKRTQLQSDCTGDKLSVTQTALQNCAQLASAAAEAAKSGDASKVEEYFKSSDSQVRDEVADVLTKVAGECGSTDGGVSKYYCTDVQNGCEPQVLAYTVPSQSFQAYCDLYFTDLPDLASSCHQQDKATTNLHETTHLSQIKGTDDLGYGYDNAMKLSTQDALNNADTYALFANAINLKHGRELGLIMSSLPNFCFPVTVLHSTRIKLVPFSAETHAPKFHELTKDDAALYRHVNNGPYSSLQQFLDEFVQPLSNENEYMLTYAIIDKTRPASPEGPDPDGQLVGIISYVDADDESFSTEIGFVFVAREFQGRGIGTEAAALMVTRALDSEEDGGLGLCRVEWHCSTMNAASIRTARKLSFEEIGTVEYERILPDAEARGKIGNGRLPGPPRSRPGDQWRDLVMLSISWCAWRDEVKHSVSQLL
ncbi:metallo-endopeptidase [Purpureocillium lavendulum]|uniref:Neutral protease 2 n=1 Tax=Purpureocillium lavendulum TaxID=1247861 RepID=A0AB34FZI2_9HYPO|nr:metallo-endopeptidase [Purpureocillium lavendulum]